jgi:hypothetical protein
VAVHRKTGVAGSSTTNPVLVNVVVASVWELIVLDPSGDWIVQE